jgi:O-antigen/teichoic acid export membrane protein
LRADARNGCKRIRLGLQQTVLLMLIRQSIIYGVGQILPAALAFGLIAFYTRTLSPAEFGVYAFVFMNVILLNSAFMLWIALAGMRLLGRAEERQPLLWGLLVCFASVSALLVLAGIGLFLWLENVGDRSLLVIGLALLLFQGWFDINQHLLSADLEAARHSTVNIIKAALGASVSVTLVLMGWGARGMLIGLIVGVALPGLWLTVRYWRHVRLFEPHFEKLKQIVTFGLPFSMSSMVGQIVEYTDRYVITQFVGIQTLGLYAVGYQVSDRVMKALMTPIAVAALPLAIKKLEDHGDAKAKSQLEQNLILLLAVGAPAAFGLAAIAPDLTQIMVGPEYRAAAVQVIPIIAIATLFNRIRSNYLDHAFHLGLRTKELIYQFVSVAVLNIVLCVYLVIEIGFIGAAWSTLVAQAFGVVVSYFVGRRIFQLPFPIADIAKVLAAAILMYIIVQMVPNYLTIVSLLGRAALGAVLYCAALFLLDPLGIRKELIDRVQSKLNWGVN